MIEIWKIECEWDSNIVDSMKEWIEKAGVDTETLIGRTNSIEEAKWAMKQLSKWEKEINYGDGRIYQRYYEIRILDT